MRRSQEEISMLLGRFVGGLTGRKTATKISLVACLLWGFGRDDKLRNLMEYYQEAILLLVQ